MRSVSLSVFLAAIACTAFAEISIDIDLGRQKASLLQDGKVLYETPISSGKPGRRTPTGDFQVLEKDLNHLSSLYGKIVDANGDVVVRDADAAMVTAPGQKFIPAPMHYFIRFDGAVGMHAGKLPGYPASHGCVRLPKDKAILFFNTVPVGSEVRVHGEPPDRQHKQPLLATGVAGHALVVQPTPPPQPPSKPRRNIFSWLFGGGKPAPAPAPAPAPTPTPTPAPAPAPAPQTQTQS